MEVTESFTTPCPAELSPLSGGNRVHYEQLLVLQSSAPYHEATSLRTIPIQQSSSYETVFLIINFILLSKMEFLFSEKNVRCNFKVILKIILNKVTRHVLIVDF